MPPPATDELWFAPWLAEAHSAPSPLAPCLGRGLSEGEAINAFCALKLATICAARLLLMLFLLAFLLFLLLRLLLGLAGAVSGAGAASNDAGAGVGADAGRGKLSVSAVDFAAVADEGETAATHVDLALALHAAWNVCP